MNTPLVSICCMTYNHEKYIRQCLEGFVVQKTNFTFEILVHEDASTDNAASIIKEYEEKYPHLFRCVYQTENQFAKQNTLTNILFQMSRGKYIALCEGDDYWTDPYKLQKQVDFLEANPDYCLVYSDYNILIEKKNKIYPAVNKSKNKIMPTGEIFEDILINNPIATLTVCARADVLKKSYDFEVIKKKCFLSGDLPMWLAISRYGKIHYIDEPMATYRLLEESASHSKDNLKTMKYFKSSYDQIRYFAKKYGCSEKTKRMIDYDYFSRLLKIGFLMRNKKLGNTAYNKLFSCKELRNKITIKQKLFYYGSRNVIIWYFVLLFRKIKRVFNSR